MTLIRLIIIILLIIVVISLEDNIINKDLYKVLGITKDAAINDIKKAYRKLAQVHHPDKAKGPDKQLHEALFREIAEAYEILSDNNQRQEYDDRRIEKSNQKRYEQDMHKQQQEYQRQYQQQQDKYQEYQRYMQKQYEAYEQQQRQQYEQQQFFDDLLHDFYQSSFFQPEIIGSILPAGEVIFPYVPIMTSEDRSHFAMLDVHCSLGIYRGNVDDVVRHLIRGLTPDLTSLAVELKFRTEGEPSLKGNCFGGLDDIGILRIFKGHPDTQYSPIWTSHNNAEHDNDYDSYSNFQRYYLELSNTGELAVLSLIAGAAEAECIWSTTNCNIYVAIINDIRSQTKQIFKAALDDIMRVYRSFVRGVLSFIDDVKTTGIIEAATDLMNNIQRNVNDFFDTLINGDKKRHRYYY